MSQVCEGTFTTRQKHQDVPLRPYLPQVADHLLVLFHLWQAEWNLLSFRQVYTVLTLLAITDPHIAMPLFQCMEWSLLSWHSQIHSVCTIPTL